MPKEVDDTFYDRADAHFHLANEQVEDIGRGKVSASFMYAAARFNSWAHAFGFSSGGEMRAAKEETIEYFVKQHRAMLTENLDDYIQNFESYMQPPSANA